jgi:hypothetical protein
VDRDYIILMGPWGTSGPVEVTSHPVRTIALPSGVLRRVDDSTDAVERAAEGMCINREET